MPSQRATLVPIPKPRMIIAQIVQLTPLHPQPPIPLSPLALPILPSQAEKEHRTRARTDPQKPQTDPEPNRVGRRLAGNVDIRRDNPTRITEADLHRATHATLVVPAHTIAQPGERDGLRDVSADGNEVDGHIADADGDRVLGEKDSVADRRDENADNGEGVAMVEAVGEECGEERDNGRGDIDGDTVDLGTDSRPAELLEDSWGEEGGAVAGVDDAEVHDCSEGISISITTHHIHFDELPD